MERRQIGPVEREREVVAGHRVVEIDQSREVEAQVRVADDDAAVELPVAEPAVEAQRIVHVSLEAEALDAPRHRGIRPAAAHHAVDPGVDGRVAHERAASQQRTHLQVAGDRSAADAPKASAAGPHLQIGDDRSGVGGRLGLRVERVERTLEAERDADRTGTFEHRTHALGKAPPAEVPQQVVDGLRRGREPREPHIEARAVEVGQPRRRQIARKGDPLADPQAAQLHAQIVDLARGIGVEAAQNEVPVAELRREIGDVVGGERGVAHRGFDAHLAYEILVIGPRAADQRYVRQRDVRTLGDQVRLFEPEAAVVHVETARKVVEHEAAPLARRERTDGHRKRRAVEHEVVDAGREVVEVHVAEVDAVRGIAVLQPLEAEFHVADRRLADREAERPLLGFVGIGQPVDQLLDVHDPFGHFAQAELRPGDLGTIERHPAAEDAEPRHEGLDATGVKQRILLVILDIKIAHAHLAEVTDLHPTDAHLRVEFLRHDARRLAHDGVLHGGNAEQQRKQKGKNRGDDYDRRDRLSQYFYNFAHR